MDAQEVTKGNTPRPFRWTKVNERAAVDVADDRRSDEQIAAVAGVTRKCLATWKRHPEFAARVIEHREVFAAAALSEGIANRWQRLRRINTDWRRAQALIEARAEEMTSTGEVSGGETGLLARDVKSIGAGENAHEVNVYRVDTGLLAELRAMEKQAAEELGQWVEKHEEIGAKPVIVAVLSGLSMGDL